MNAQICNNLSQTMRIFTKFLSENNAAITPKVFSEEFGKIQKQFLIAKQKDMFCKEADLLARDLVKDEKIDFAGIVLSALCKLTQFIPDQLEKYATKGLRVAEMNNDPIHMMARLNDLRNLYFRKPDKLHQYLGVLHKQEQCLKEIIGNYCGALESFHTVQRHPAPKKDYELMLAHIQTEISKITKRKHPQEAKERLIEARQTFEKRGYHKNIDYIDMLLNEIEVSTRM